MKIPSVFFRIPLALIGLYLLTAAAQAQTWNNLPGAPVTGTPYSFSFTTGSPTHGTTVTIYSQAPGSSTWTSTGGGGGPASPGSFTANGSITFSTAGQWKLKAVDGFTPTANQLGSQATLNVTSTPTATTFSFSNLSFTYDGNTKTATVTPNPANATYTSDLTKGPGAGSYTVSASANGSFSGSGSDTLVINKADQSTVSLSPGSQTVSLGATLNFTASGGGVGGYNWSGSASGTGGSASVTFNALGTFSVTVQSPGDGNYNASNAATSTISVVDSQAPSVPSGLSSASITSTSFTLNWAASSDNVGVTAYEVSRSGTSLGTTGATSLSVTGLTQGTTYAMAVRAQDAAGNWSAWSGSLNVQTADTQAPTAPAGLNATSMAATSFTLNWTASSDNIGVTSYSVYNGATLVGTTGATSLAITGLTQGTTYPMTVKSADATGNVSAASTVLNVQTSDTQAPSVPSSLSSASVTSTSFTLNWTASSDNLGVTAYEVSRSGTSLGTTGATSLSVTGLTQGTTYAMTVRARDAAGNWSAWSGALNVQTSDTQAPAAPSGLNATSVAATSFTLNWTASSDNIGITSYSVYNGATLVGTTGATSLAITGLTQGTTYPMTVKAADAAGNVSAASGVLNVQTLDTQAPTVPSGLGSASITSTSFTLSWAASSDNLGVTAYEVSRSGTSLGTTGATSLSITGLTQGTTYAMTVRARDAAGNWSAWSGALNVQTTDTQAPTVPAGLNATSVTMTSFTLNWGASTDNVGVTAYEIFRGGVSQGTTATLSFPQTGLSPNTAYAMTVRARDAAGNWSALSSALNVTTLADTATPSIPSGLNATSIGATSFTLNWAASTDNIGVTAYEVFRGGVSQGTTTALTLAQTGLSPGVTYAMTARARDAAGNWSAQSSVSNITTSTDTTAPSVPGGLNATAKTATGFTLNWTASTDNVAVTGYEVFRGGVSQGTTTALTFVQTGLSSSTAYAMTVRARDAAGNWSAQSTALSVTTLADTTAPIVPGGLNATAKTATGFTLNWTASTDNVAVTGYEVFRGGVSQGTTATLSFAQSGLSPSTAYSMTVRARDAAGNWSAQSTALSVTTLADTTAPSVPTGLSSATVTQTTFTLNWTAATDNVAVTAYEVFRNGVSQGTTASLTQAQTGLAPNTLYAMRVRARDAAGNWSAQSTALNVTTLADATAPTVPAGLNATATTATTFTLNWTASTDAIGVTAYEIFRNGVSQGTTASLTLAQTGLAPSTLYAMTVRARDAAGNWSAQSTALNVTTLADTTAPSVPAGLSSATVTQTTFTLNWAASTDNVAVIAYEVFRNGASQGTTAALTQAQSGLSPGTLYAMTVRARDAAGNWSAQSTALNVTTLADATPPTVPIGLVASAIANTSFTLSWTASTDNVAVTGYRVYKGGVEVSGSPTAATSLAITGLLPNTAYAMTVKAYDAVNNLSGASTPLSVTTTNNPTADSDGDGVPDVIEVQLGTNPNSVKSNDTGNATGLKVNKP